MNNAEYHKLRAVNASLLKSLQISPAHCFAQYLDPNREPQKPTHSLQMGSLVHCLALTPGTFNDEFVVADYERRSKAGRASYEALTKNGPVIRTVVKPRDLKIAELIVESLQSRPHIKTLLDFPFREKTIIFERTGAKLPLKARLDAFAPATNHILELKTIRSLELVNVALLKYRYLLSAAFYMDIVGAQQFTFAFVETCEPYNAITLELTYEQYRQGHEQAQDMLELFDECYAANDWPDTPTFNHDPIMTMPINGAPIDLEL